MLLIFLYGGAIAINNYTIVNWQIPWSIALTLSLLTWIPLGKQWERSLPNIHRLLRLLIHLTAATSMFIFMIFAINFFLADDSSTHIEKAIVEGHYRETHYKSERVGRRVYKRGAPYYEYLIRVKFSDGRIKDITVPKKRYDRIRNGSTLEIKLKDGFFGFPVLERKQAFM